MAKWICEDCGKARESYGKVTYRRCPDCDLKNLADIVKKDAVAKLHCSDGLKTPAGWEQETKIQILDPDGWRFKHAKLEPKSYREAITREEFMARATWSTCQGF